ncbi:hypothetical protein K8R62_01345, partial [bacterium]|nr:hypothetical protein [bacterium]
LADYYLVELFLNKDFTKFQKAMDYLLRLTPKDHEAYDDLNDMKYWSEEEFQEEISGLNRTEEEVLEDKIEATTDIQSWVYQLDYEKNNLESIIEDFNAEVSDKEINKDNFSRELAIYYLESIRGMDFVKFQKSMT